MKLLTPLSRRVLAYLRPYRFPYLVILVVAMIVSSMTDGAIPLLVKHFTDQITHLSTVQIRMVQIVSLELVVLFILRSVSGFSEDYLSAYIGQHITLDIRSGLNRRLQRMSLSFFNRTPSGMMISRVVNDVGVISNGITDGAFSVVGEGATLIGVLAAAFWLDWKLALIAFVVFPCAVGPVMAFSRRMRKITKKAQKQMSGITSLLQEAYQGNRVVKAFGMEEYERERFDVELRRLFKFSMRAAVIKAADRSDDRSDVGGRDSGRALVRSRIGNSWYPHHRHFRRVPGRDAALFTNLSNGSRASTIRFSKASARLSACST